MGLSMGGSLCLRLAEQRARRGRRARAGQPVRAHRAPRPPRCCPSCKHVVPAFPGISNDIKKPGQDEGALRPDAAARGCTRCSRPGCRSAPTSPKVTAPLLLLHSREDHVVEPSNAACDPRARHRAPTATRSSLEDSYHVATLDNDAPLIFERSLDFVRAHAPAAS